MNNSTFNALTRPARMSGLAVLLGVTVVAPAARADDSATGLAQALFDDARSLMDTGRYSEACPKLAESQRLDPGGGTLLNLAICRDREGKTATAWSLYHSALETAKKDGRADREKLARERIEAVTPRLARVRVRVAEGARAIPDLVVRLDDVTLGPNTWGTAIPVDPGDHRVMADAPGHRPFMRPVVAPKAGETLDVEVGVPARDTSSALTMSSVKMRANPPFFAMVALTGVGIAVSVVTGAIWMFQAITPTSPAGCDYDRKFCRDDAALAPVRDQYNLALVSTISGLVAVGAGLSLIFIPARVPDESSKATAGVRARPIVMPHGARSLGLGAEVRF